MIEWRLLFHNGDQPRGVGTNLSHQSADATQTKAPDTERTLLRVDGFDLVGEHRKW